jgi:hypothetical protein
MSRSDSVRTLSPFYLSDSDFGDCGSPDAIDSPGARFLVGVRDDAVERFDSEQATSDPLDDDWTMEVAQEIADSHVPIYTSPKWATFVDLQAYHEDVSEYGESTDMDKMSDLALYMIAERLAVRVFEALAEERDNRFEMLTYEGTSEVPNVVEHGEPSALYAWQYLALNETDFRLQAVAKLDPLDEDTPEAFSLWARRYGLDEDGVGVLHDVTSTDNRTYDYEVQDSFSEHWENTENMTTDELNDALS